MQEASGHEGAKPQRVAFCENLGYLFTCGFSKMSARQYAVWDTVSLIFLKFVNNKIIMKGDKFVLVISYMNYTSSKIERFDHGNSAALPKEHLKVISQKNVYYEN